MKDKDEMLNVLLDEINGNLQRAITMINCDLDLPTLRFYEGQRIVLQRILDSIEL
jgi:hypothetical protein